MKKLILWTSLLALLGTSGIALADTTSVLLIPTKDTLSAIQMFDPFDGHYLGEFMRDSVSNFRYNATQGPDGNIYVSSLYEDAIFVYDNSGNYLYTYADASDGINYAKGFAFRGDHLFVGIGYRVAEFDGPHSRLPDFIDSLNVYGPIDIEFLEDGRSLVSVVGSDKVVRLYNADGTPSADLFSTSGHAHQIQPDPQRPGAYLNVSFDVAGLGMVIDFDIDGTIHNVIPNIFRGGGVYRLGNGNLLLTNNNPSTGGVYEITNAGDTVDVELADIRAYWIELCVVEIPGSCGAYVVGDFNGSEEFNVADLIAAFSKLKTGSPDAALLCDCEDTGNEWAVAMDVNNSCVFNIADIIAAFSKLKTGSPELAACELCPPDA